MAFCAKADTVELRKAIESQHGGTATLAQSVPVRETFEDQPVWEGIVHVFDLEGHPIATAHMRGHLQSKEATNADPKKQSPFTLLPRLTIVTRNLMSCY
jgi:hypothetical protein